MGRAGAEAGEVPARLIEHARERRAPLKLLRGPAVPRPTLPEAIALGYTVVGGAVGLLVGGAAAYLTTIAALAGVLALTAVLLVRFAGLGRDLARALSGVALTFVVYAALPPLLDLRAPHAIDAQLWALERALLGTTAVEVLEPYASAELTALFGLVYTLHAPLFFAPALLHWRGGRRQRAERLLLALALAMYLGFLGYALWPAYGPIALLTDLRPIGSNPATVGVATYGVALGTFPSLHAAISAAVAIDAWRTNARSGVAFTLVAAAIWLSTIYLRYHWVPDLLAGLLLAAFTYWLAGRLGAPATAGRGTYDAR